LNASEEISSERISHNYIVAIASEINQVKITNINHYIIGCNAIGQFNGSSNLPFNISNGSLNRICDNVN
jgi:hypothetical protein